MYRTYLFTRSDGSILEVDYSATPGCDETRNSWSGDTPADPPCVDVDAIWSEDGEAVAETDLSDPEWSALLDEVSAAAERR